MTTAPTPQPEALADQLEDMTCLWSPSDNRDLVNNAAAELRRLQAENERLRSAERTLQRLGYQDRGGQEWAPPIGKAPDFDLIDSLRSRIAELEGKVGRLQGVPLPLIEAINAATGSNDWQGDHSPAELLGPACKAIEAMDVEKTMPTIEDASQDWGKVDPAIAWHLIERHADSWADIGKMMTEYVQAQIARAELEARKPLPLSDEQIDAIADGMPGGLGGFMKTWGWRQFARKILDLRAPPTWAPQFDAMAPGQEELAVQFCAEIAGPRGKPGRNPDPVRLLEMAEALYKAEADARPKET